MYVILATKARSLKPYALKPMVYSDWSDSPLEEFEYPDEPDQDNDFDQDEEFDDSDTIPCPECGEDIYEDSPACPYCGHYITSTASTWSGRSSLWLGIGLAGILAVIAALVLGGF